MANIAQGSDQRFLEKIRNFPTNLYRVDDRNSHIFKLLYTLLEIGIGQVRGLQDLANQSQDSLAGTEGSELDQFFQMFGIKRNPDLIYNGNYYKDNSIETFEEFRSLDAKFRVAIAKMLQAIQKGGTAEGFKLMSEATVDFPVQVIEPWHNETEYARFSPTINQEIVIVVIPDVELSEEEKTQIKARLIQNLEMIRPVGTLITIEILENVNNQITINPDYAAAGSFTFLSDNSSQYLELLSQEKEIDLNEFVVDANAFTTTPSFSTVLGTLNTNGDLDNSLIINETVSPNTPLFFALLSNSEKSEIVLVYNRYLLDTNTLSFVYDVVRAQSGTTQINWNLESNVTIQFNLMEQFVSSSEFTSFGQWIPIPLADSPDNYPNGKFEGDPNKYDANGYYLFEWANQSEFFEWFKKDIEKMGGEIVDNNYRLPIITTVNNVGDNLMSALGAPYPILRPIITPKQ